MADRNGIFAGDDPFAIAQSWLDTASNSEPNDPNAAVLSTVDAQGLPNSRVILVKSIESDGLVFFTNYQGKKAREIADSGKAALNFHWKSLERQMRFRGEIRKVEPRISDEYYQSRPLGSRIGAWASRQSEPLESKAALLAAVAKAQLQHGLNPARPPHWGGFKVYPTEVEFWAAGEFRIHNRFQWQRDQNGDGWNVCRLNP